MTTTNQQKFFRSLLTETKLFFLLLFIFGVIRTSANPDPLNFFIIVHDRECSEGRSVASALLESKVLSNKEYMRFENQLGSVVQWTRSERLQMSPANEETPIRRRLGELDWQERRDQIISALDLLVEKELTGDISDNHTLSRSLTSPTPSVSRQFYMLLGMDVIDGSLLKGTRLRDIAEGLPCLSRRPQPNLRRFPMAVPNDFNVVKQWYLSSAPKGIGAPKAWECSNGQKNGPVVAVIDSGCSPHPDLQGNYCTSKDACAGFDAVDGKNPFVEHKVHGTPVASVIAAVANNDYGIAGVCWGCKIMCVKASDEMGDFYSHTILGAIEYILSKKDVVRITNHSYGGYGHSDSEADGYKDLEEAGIIAVVAAGNEGCNMDDPDECLDPDTDEWRGDQRPGGLDFDNIITVGATDIRNRKASFSNYGKTQVDLFAPGSSIEALCNIDIQNCYSKAFIGTSFSAPIVTGAVALIWAQDPTLSYKEVKEILMKTVRKVKTLQPYSVSGGIIDIGAAMELVKKKAPCSTPSHDLISPPANIPKLRPRKGKPRSDDDEDEDEDGGLQSYDDNAGPSKKLKKKDSSTRSNFYIPFFPVMIPVVFFLHDFSM